MIAAAEDAVERPAPEIETAAAMKAARRWLLSDAAKVPHYVDGRRRQGALDTDADRAALATYADARSALAKAPDGWLLGFALGPDGDGHWQGIDLDKIEANGLAGLANGLPGYVERSPSGIGAHAIGYGRAFRSLGSNGTGIESYSGGRYFTVTENIVRDAPLCCLGDFVENTLAPRHRRQRDDRRTSGAASTDANEQVLAWLYSRPNNLSRDDWVRLCFALKGNLGDRARDGWLAFSRRYSGEVTPGEAERQWETANPRGDVAIGTAIHLLGGFERRESAFQRGTAWREHVDPETGECFDQEPREQVEPVDLWRRYSTPELPKGLLPATIEDFARKHGEVMGVDPAGLAMAALAVCSAAITDEIKLQVKRHDPTWRESARLWVGLVGSPSMKKTPIINAAVRPLRRIDATLMRAYTAQATDYEALSPKERKAVDRPRQERRVISDSTIEAAQEVLRDSPRGVLSVQDELSGWFGSMDKYAPGKGAMADRSFWLQAFNGGSYSLNRISRGASYIPNCSIGLLGGVQPEPIRAIAGDTHDDGLIQRLLPVILRSGATGRDVPADGAVDVYERLIERLEVMKPPARQGVVAFDGQAQPLRFDDRARAVRERLEAEHLGLVQAMETVSPKLAAHFGKYDGLFARLCVIWHCVEAEGVQPAAEVCSDTAERVERFMAEFIRPSAIAFYAGLLGLSAGHEDLLALASWIVASDIDEVKARDVQSSSQSFRHVTADQVRTLCEKLEAFGWGEWAEPGPKSNKPRFMVNPLVHERFAHRGEEEQARRATVREAINRALSE